MELENLSKAPEKHELDGMCPLHLLTHHAKAVALLMPTVEGEAFITS